MLPRLLVVLAVAAISAGVPQSGTLSAVSGLQRPIRAMSSTVRPAEAALVGTIEKFVSEGRQLILRTHEGHHVTFIVDDGAVLRMGSKTLTTADLERHSGRRAKVRFTESDGKRTAHWVMISSEAPKTAQ
jgi:hypothetical protein